MSNEAKYVMDPQPKIGDHIKAVFYTKHPFSPSAFVGTPAEGKIEGEERMSWLAEDFIGNPIAVAEADWIKCPYESTSIRFERANAVGVDADGREFEPGTWLWIVNQ